MSKQHRVIIETENEVLANLITNLFGNGYLTQAISESPEYQRQHAEGIIEGIPEETEVYLDELNRSYKTHKVQL